MDLKNSILDESMHKTLLNWPPFYTYNNKFKQSIRI